MMNGASTLEGYVPDVDATIVTRILDAGGTILGKAVCEYFCFSGGSHTSASGPVHNPLPPRLFGRRLVVRQRGAARGRRGRPRDRRRSGRLDPHPGRLLRHLRHEADPRPGALYRRHADRADHRPHRADERHCRRQRADARGAGRAPTGSTRASRASPADRYTEALGQGAARPAHRGGARRLRPRQLGGGRRCQGQAGRRGAAPARRHGRRGLDPDAPDGRCRSGCRSRPRARPCR